MMQQEEMKADTGEVLERNNKIHEIATRQEKRFAKIIFKVEISGAFWHVQEQG